MRMAIIDNFYKIYGRCNSKTGIRTLLKDKDSNLDRRASCFSFMFKCCMWEESCFINGCQIESIDDMTPKELKGVWWKQ